MKAKTWKSRGVASSGMLVIAPRSQPTQALRCWEALVLTLLRPLSAQALPGLRAAATGQPLHPPRDAPSPCSTVTLQRPSHLQTCAPLPGHKVGPSPSLPWTLSPSSLSLSVSLSLAVWFWALSPHSPSATVCALMTSFTHWSRTQLCAPTSRLLSASEAPRALYGPD